MTLHVYHNEATDWFVAESAEEAASLYRAWRYLKLVPSGVRRMAKAFSARRIFNVSLDR